jgi:hypothetical protein
MIEVNEETSVLIEEDIKKMVAWSKLSSRKTD